MRQVICTGSREARDWLEEILQMKKEEETERKLNRGIQLKKNP